tara:strand:- start:101 stop:490 length:390 start_codon:yes stop_codon:yes gene_type:complete
MSIEAIAFHVSNDEGAFLLREYDADKPGMGEVRWQELRVVRNNRIVTYKESLGSVDMFPGSRPINIIGGDPSTGEVYETVGSLRDMADEMRDNGFSEDLFDVAPTGTPEQWVEAYHDERLRRAAKSTEG